MQFVGHTDILLLFQVTKLFWFHYAAISNKPRSNLQRSKKQGSVVTIMTSLQQMYVGSLKLPRPQQNKYGSFSGKSLEKRQQVSL